MATIAAIYNQGIEDRVATFETRLRTAEDIRCLVRRPASNAAVEQEGRIIAFAATFDYRPRACYAGIAEVSIYVEREFRGRGAGRVALVHLIELAEAGGFWKLLSRVFPENHASRALIRSVFPGGGD